MGFAALAMFDPGTGTSDGEHTVTISRIQATNVMGGCGD
jgi:hypothetical protein